MLSKQLLEILCCPQCHGELRYEAEEERLTCKACGKVYKIQNDIPIMLIDNEPNAS